MTGGTCRRCGAPASDGRCSLCGSSQIEHASVPPPAAPAAPVGAPPSPPPNLHLAASAASSKPRSKAPAIAIGVIGVIAVVGLIGGALSMKRPSTGSTVGATQPVTSSRTNASTTGASQTSTRQSAQGAGLARTSLQPGSWIAVLESLPKSDVTETDAAARIAGFGGSGPVVLVDTDAVPGLNSGYWTLAIIDASSKEAARAACARVGRDVGPTCYPREIG